MFAGLQSVVNIGFKSVSLSVPSILQSRFNLLDLVIMLHALNFSKEVLYKKEEKLLVKKHGA